MLILCGDYLDRYDISHIGLFLLQLFIHCKHCNSFKHYKHLKKHLLNPLRAALAANDASNVPHNPS